MNIGDTVQHNASQELVKIIAFRDCVINRNLSGKLLIKPETFRLYKIVFNDGETQEIEGQYLTKV